MRQNRTTIEINGKQYDAQTGRLVGGALHADKMRVIDGIAAPSKTAKRAHLSEPQPIHTSRTSHKTHPAAQMHHTQRHSETLQRKLVKRPSVSATPVAEKARVATPKGRKPIHHVSATISRRADILPSNLASNLASPDKAFRAKSINRSHLVSRFGTLGHEGVIKRVAPMDVRKAPVDRHHAITQPHHEAPLSSQMSSQSTIENLASHTADNSSLLERGIERATAHQAAPHRQASHRRRVAHRLGIHPNLINVGAAAMIGLLLIGFFVYQNNTNLALRVASHKAGVAATAPTTIPSGYALGGPIKYAPGMVAFNYKAHGSNKTFTLSEQVSQWTSSTLFSNMFADGTVAYQTHQQNGLTIYTYGQGNATWVSGGVRYDVTGDAGLNNDQIIKMAASL